MWGGVQDSAYDPWAKNGSKDRKIVGFRRQLFHRRRSDPMVRRWYRRRKCFPYTKFHLGLRFCSFFVLLSGNWVSFGFWFLLWIFFSFFWFFFSGCCVLGRIRVTYFNSLQPETSFYFYIYSFVFVLGWFGIFSFQIWTLLYNNHICTSWVHFRAKGRLVYGKILEKKWNIGMLIGSWNFQPEREIFCMRLWRHQFDLYYIFRVLVCGFWVCLSTFGKDSSLVGGGSFGKVVSVTHRALVHGRWFLKGVWVVMNAWAWDWPASWEIDEVHDVSAGEYGFYGEVEELDIESYFPILVKRSLTRFSTVGGLSQCDLLPALLFILVIWGLE